MFDYAVGQRASLAHTFDAGEVAAFARLVGGAALAAGAPPQQVPNGLVGGLFSRLLGTALPGRGTNWLKQRLRFFAPAWVGEPLAAWVEIVRVRPEKKLINLHVACVARSGAVVCDGEALVLALEMARAP